MSSCDGQRILLLSGGVGGAKLVRGFSLLEGLAELSVVVNVGDDFEHLGLYISPDIDTVLYTLAGLAHREQGWGLENESWRTLTRLGELGGDTWFRLGDMDLATHLYRTAALQSGRTLSEVIADLVAALRLGANVWPATDQRLRTVLDTDRGELDFQHYFVRERCAPVVERIRYAGAQDARPSAPLDAALGADQDRYDVLILTPSNPFLSLDPILAVPGLASRLRALCRRVLAISPIIAGRAVKGPTAKLMRELDLPVSAQGWLSYMDAAYPGLIDEWVLDETDMALESELCAAGYRVHWTDTLMTDDAQKRRLARRLAQLGNEHA